MKKIKRVTHDLIKENKRKRDVRHTVSLMSVIVMLLVMTALIIPAISLTKDEYEGGTVPTVPSVNELSSLAAFELPDSQVDNVNFTQVMGKDGNNIQEVEFELAYTLNPDDVTTTKPYLIYPITSSNIAVADELPGVGTWGKVMENSRQSGIYHIYKDTSGVSYVLIQFFDDYLQDYSGQNIMGTVRFKADVVRDDHNNNATQEITIGGQTITITNYPVYVMNISKTGTFNPDTKTITWTINVHNPNAEDMGGAVITDEKITSTTDISVTPANVITKNGNQVVINNGIDDELITLTYTEAVDPTILASGQGQSVGNQVNMTKGENNYQDSAWAYVPSGYSIAKGAVTDYSTDEYVWTITVNNTFENNLNGFKIEDVMINNMVANSLSVTGDNNSNLNSKVSYSSGTVTLGNITDSQVVITYRTAIDTTREANQYHQIFDNNTAILKNPSNTTIGQINATAVYMKPYGYKEHQYDSNTGYVNYSVQYKRAEGDVMKSGDYLEDPYLQYAVPGSIVVHKGYWGELTEGTHYEISGNKVTLKVDLSTVLLDRSNPEFFSIRYSIDPKNPNIPYTVDGNKKVFVNTAEYGSGPNPYGTVSDTYTWEPTNTIYKQVNGTATTVDNGDGTKTYTIPWSVVLEQEPGGFMGKTLTDTTSIVAGTDTHTNTADGSTYQNYYNTGSMTIKYYVKDPTYGNDNEYTLGSSYYTLTDEAYGGFTVYFKDDTEASDTPLITAHKIVMQYSTKAVSSTSEELKAKNNAAFDGKNNGAEYTIPYVDPNSKLYDKEADARINVDNLEKKTVNSVVYYKVPYVIHMDLSKRDGLADPTFTLVDTMPTGAKLDTESFIKFRYNENWAETIQADINQVYYNYYTYDDSTNEFKIFFKHETDQNKQKFDIEYFVLLPKEATDEAIADANGSYEITNSIQDENKENPKDDAVSILGGEEPNVDDIKKTGGQGATDGYVDYVLDVNPSATDMSTGGTIDIEDALNLANLSVEEATTLYNVQDASKIDTNVDLGNVKVTLDSLKVYEIDGNGTPTLLNHNEYVYEFSGVKKTHSTVDQEFDLEPGSNGYLVFNKSGETIAAGKAGDTYDLIVNCDTPGARLHSWGIQGSNYSGVREHDPGMGEITFDSNGQYTFTGLTLPVDLNLGYLQFGDYWWSGDNQNINLTTGKAIFHTTKEIIENPQLGLTLPDGKHLRVEYTYKIVYESTKDKVGLKLTNSATLEKANGSETSDSENNISIKDSTSATSSTSVPIKLNKVNLNNMNIQVEAGFNLYRYNPDLDVWQVATDIREKQVQIGSHHYDTHIVSNNQPGDEWSGWTNATSQSAIDSAVKIRTDDYFISLEKGVIYMLVEVEAPNPYILLNEPKFFTYGHEAESGVPAAARNALAAVPGNFNMDVSNIENITNNGDGEAVYSISNRNYINVSATKNWTVTDNIDTSDYKVKVGVYRTGKNGRVNNLPSDHDELMQLIQTNGWEKVDEKELSESNNWSYDWYGDPDDTNYNGVTLVSGSDSDTPYYYYVVEEAVYKTTDNGNTWTDVTGEFATSSAARWLIVGTDAALAAGLDHTQGIVNLYNASGLAIKKIWQNSHRVEMTPAELARVGLSQIEVELYRSTTGPSGGTYDEFGIPTDAVKLTASDLAGVNGITTNGDNIVIKQSDGWEALPEGLPVTDGVNPYYYYTKEVTQIADSQTVYVDNGQTGGSIFVYNIVDVEDNDSVVLPNTGGKGSRLLRIISLLMILISFITLVYRKRVKGINNKYISKRRRKGGWL